MLIGRLGICLKVLTSLTLAQAPCREQIFKFMGVNRKTKMWEHFVSTSLIVSTCGFIAIIFPNITNAFAFAGGTFEIFIAGVFPMWLYVKFSKD